MASRPMPRRLAPTLQQPINMPTGDINNIASLQKELERLPQEIYDEIYDLTFTANAAVRLFFNTTRYESRGPCSRFNVGISPGSVPPLYNRVAKNERPPKNLIQMDRASRFKYARSFYGQKSIVVVCGALGLIKLLSRMHSDHVPLIRVYFRDTWGGEVNEVHEKQVWSHLERFYPALRPEAVQFSGMEKAVKLEFGYE